MDVSRILSGKSRQEKSPPFVSTQQGSRLARLASVLEAMSPSDSFGEELLAERWSSLWKRYNVQAQREDSLDPQESRSLRMLADLMTLRRVVFGRPENLKERIQAGMVWTLKARPLSRQLSDFSTTQAKWVEVSSAASSLSHLYWNLYRCASGEAPVFSRVARKLYHEIFGELFHPVDSLKRIEPLCDAIQSAAGAVFLVLNLLRRGALADAAQVAREVVVTEVLVDEDRSVLYWLASLLRFCREYEQNFLGHDETLRHLYHLTLIAPERAGFLEIDGPFWAEFGSVNEAAREGFQFKDDLIVNTLSLWKRFEGFFDDVFHEALDLLAGPVTRGVRGVDAWESYWIQKREQHGAQYLHLVEGNLSYVAGQYKAAAVSYQTALELEPDLRPAQVNLLYVLAKLGNRESFLRHVEVALKNTPPATGLLAVSNASLLLGDVELSDVYASQLSKRDDWKEKIYFYRALFCRDMGLDEFVLRFARNAVSDRPEHLPSRVLLAQTLVREGQFEEVLKLLDVELPADPDDSLTIEILRFRALWKSGKTDEAGEILHRLPKDSVMSSEELKEFFEFAHASGDLVLLRRLAQLKQV